MYIHFIYMFGMTETKEIVNNNSKIKLVFRYSLVLFVTTSLDGYKNVY